jgi:hypothetical protein
MKIRIKGNSLRYRLTKSDVAQLAEEGHLQEEIDFILFVPNDVIKELAETDKVGFEGKHESLHLLVEKDFTCLDNVAEDHSDNYPNPLADKK